MVTTRFPNSYLCFKRRFYFLLFSKDAALGAFWKLRRVRAIWAGVCRKGQPLSLLDDCVGVAVRGQLHSVCLAKVEAFHNLTWEMYFSLHVSQPPTQSQVFSGTAMFQVSRLVTGRNLFYPPAKMSCPFL